MFTEGRIERVRSLVAEAKLAGKKTAFVPTMGALHEGHLSLVRTAKEKADFVVMSIFVNRIQFNDSNDFINYPKTLEDDLNLASDNGVDLVFIPDEDEIYRDHKTYVDVEGLTEELCGAHRPGHFRGVFTVVSKLFNIVQPDIAVFGQKDIQQAVSIEKMVSDLNFPIEIIVAPIIREADGLAKSSRNVRLDKSQRQNAVSIYSALSSVKKMIENGVYDYQKMYHEAEKIILDAGAEKIDYITLADYHSLRRIDRVKHKAVFAVAAYFGGVRLIDNMIIDFDGEKIKCDL
ncbi:MAG TPA: pantoate--beta-alanine ligase [Spirochaetota bacterium]|nr:pantoate--beta-alanine ligase [Spirochaetota bacterium]HQE59002.1 pantoate--beta-alanine ligase [Spirochaetota bacterium]